MSRKKAYGANSNYDFTKPRIDNTIIAMLRSMTLDYQPFAVFLFIRASIFATSAEDLHNLWDETGEHCLHKQAHFIAQNTYKPLFTDKMITSEK